MEKTLEEYLLENYRDIFEEYNRYLDRTNLPKSLDKVITLRSGFGGGAGVYRTVKTVDDKYVRLTDGKYDYISEIEYWYKDMKVVK